MERAARAGRTRACRDHGLGLHKVKPCVTTITTISSNFLLFLLILLLLLFLSVRNLRSGVVSPSIWQAHLCLVQLWYTRTPHHRTSASSRGPSGPPPPEELEINVRSKGFSPRHSHGGIVGEFWGSRPQNGEMDPNDADDEGGQATSASLEVHFSSLVPCSRCTLSERRAG